MNDLSSYYIYLNERVDSVSITSFKKIKLITNELLTNELLMSMYPNHCFSNAYLISKIYPEVEYVEGEVLFSDLPIPIIHAWNKINNKHFDLTYELFKNEERSYYPVVSGTVTALIEQGYKLNYYIDLYTQFLNKPETKERIKNTKDSIYAKLRENI
jgi:hypothetical protein